LAGPSSAGDLKRLPSTSIASLPNEKDKNRDQPDSDEHPVLDFETQKGEMFNEKLHRFRPLNFVQDRRFGRINILFLYLMNGPRW
jgi:hypothetical protein